MPTRAEDRCERDVTATYEVTDSGLRVINRCRRADGRIRSAVGRARVVEDRTNARLQVSFAPSFLDALPFVWGDYWILDLADDYDAAMVGTPDRKHLWLLSRTPSLAWNRTQRLHRARQSARIRHGQIAVHRANRASGAVGAGAPDQRRRPSFGSRAARDRRRVARRIGPLQLGTTLAQRRLYRRGERYATAADHQGRRTGRGRLRRQPLAVHTASRAALAQRLRHSALPDASNGRHAGCGGADIDPARKPSWRKRRGSCGISGPTS